MQTSLLIYIWYKFFLKGVFKQTIEIWILIPIILKSIFRLTVKKIYTKYGKICEMI